MTEKKKEKKFNYVISLTSHTKERMGKLANTLLPILKYTENAKVVLTIYKDDIPNLPNLIKFLYHENEIEILVSDIDLGSHLKYFYAMQKYRNYPIITIDDDIVYVPKMFESMLKEHVIYPNHIICRSAYNVTFTNGKVNEFSKWKPIFSQTDTKNLHAEGWQGILYPPNCFDIDNSYIDEILTIKRNDDIYLNALANRNRIPIHIMWNGYQQLIDQEKGFDALSMKPDHKEVMDRDVRNFAKDFFDYDTYLANEKQAIVSVTSFGVRMNELLPKVLMSLEKQTYKNYKVCITLEQKDYDAITNEYLKKNIANGKFEVIIADENLKCHNKYFYAMKKYRDNPIITIDDDTLLPLNALEVLHDYYLRYGDKYVYARQCVQVNNFENPILGSPNSVFCKNLGHSMANFAEGFCGVLYPPNILKVDDSMRKDIRELITDDDIYLKGLEIDRGVEVMFCINYCNCLKQLDLGNSKYENESLHKQFNSNDNRAENFLKIKSKIEKYIKEMRYYFLP